MSEAERQAHLDKYYPFIEQGAEPPGRSMPLEIDGKPTGMRRWEGHPGWRTRHGPAVVRWDGGRPSHVEAANLPDGRRGEARSTLDFGWRYEAAEGDRWIYGTIDIRPDDVVFVAGEQPRYVPPPLSTLPNLEGDLARDAAFVADLQDRRFARALYATLLNAKFRKEGSPRRWSCGDRQAARITAYIRGRGNSYHDYFLDYDFPGVYPDDRADRIAALEKDLVRNRELLRQLPARRESLPADHRREEALRQVDEYERLLETSIATFEERKAAVHANADVFDRIKQHLSRLGWVRMTESEQTADRQNAVARMTALEGRPGAPTPDWAKDFRIRENEYGLILQPDRPQSGVKRQPAYPWPDIRLTKLALSGRIDKDEYDELLDWIR
ncbi:MAG TPA: hypothetical protein VF744_02385 [Beijerinckiaceae bacterium]